MPHPEMLVLLSEVHPGERHQSHRNGVSSLPAGLTTCTGTEEMAVFARVLLNLTRMSDGSPYTKRKIHYDTKLE